MPTRRRPPAGRADEGGIGDGKVDGGLFGDTEGEPGLAHTSGAGQGYEADIPAAQQGDDLGPPRQPVPIPGVPIRRLMYIYRETC
jgi:hypothetical protein